MSRNTDVEQTDLIRRLMDGDSRAAVQLVHDHAGWMLAVARRYVKDDAIAEDCVQEAFCKIFQKIGDFDGRSTLKSWMHRIVINEALTKLRSLRRNNDASIEELLPEFDKYGCRIEPVWQNSDNMTPVEVMERSDLHAVVTSEIERLPDNYRVVILLKDIEELTTPEVARILELSERNVRVRLHRARAALKKLLQPILTKEQDV